MRKSALLMFGAIWCLVTLAVNGGVVKVWDLSGGILPEGAALWPGKCCSVTAGAPRPDGVKTGELQLEAAKDGQGIGARQIIMSGPNKLSVGSQVRISFGASSSAPMKLRMMISQLHAPFAGLNAANFKDFDLGPEWRNHTWEFTVEKSCADEKIALPRVMFGAAAVGTKIKISSIMVEEITPAIPVSLAGVANMGFVDASAGDGRGGWSDQGPGNDMRDFNPQQKSFRGIPMSIVDPQQNNGKAVITFNCPQFSSGPKEIKVAVKPGTHGKYLYLLHSMCWAPGKGSSVGTIAVQTTDGNVKEYSVVSGKDIRDWWNPQPAENALIAFESGNRGIYLSKFELPGKEIGQITLKTTGQGMWIVAGMTVADREALITVERAETIAASAEWRAVDTSAPAIKANTALDLSRLGFNKPAGADGRITVNEQGKLVTEKKPETSIRFLCNNRMPSVAQIAEMSKAQIEQLADTTRRQGYNMIRLHFVDSWLLGQDSAPFKQHSDKLNLPVKQEEIVFNANKLDKLDYLIAEMKKRGIYLYLDAMTSYLGYSSGANLWAYGVHHELAAQANLLGSERYRANWKAGVSKLLEHVNPYTGMTLRDDPALAVLLFCNEQDLLPGQFRSLPGILQPAWTKFLEQKYRNWTALYQAWNGKYGETELAATGSWANVPPINANVSYGNTQAGIDTTLFFRDVEKEMTEFYQQTIKEIGYKGLTTQWDFCPRLLEVPARSMSPVVSMHNYHAHPTNFIQPGSRIDQDSSLKKGGNGFKQFTPTRFLNRPFMIMEHGIVFWNRYRHEQGLMIGAGAALQDYDALSLHGESVRLNDGGKMMTPFNNTAVDPVNRASEVITAFAFLRRDVATARHVVAFPIDDRYIFSGRAMLAFSDEWSQLWPVCRLGIRYQEDARPQAHIDMVLAGGATSKLDYQVGATGTQQKGYDATSLEAVVAQLRREGILERGNVSDPAKGVLQSDTGEIMVDFMQGTMTVNTIRLAGAVIKQNRGTQVGPVMIEKCTVPATVAVISLNDRAAIQTAGHWLVVFATDALNSGMKFTSAQRTELSNIGKLPVLLQSGKLTLTVATQAAGKKVAVYALKLNGERMEKLSGSVGNGRLQIEIDTAKLSGATPFFEVIQE